MQGYLLLVLGCADGAKVPEDTAPPPCAASTMGPDLDAAIVTLSWNAALFDDIAPWTFEGTATDNRDLWCAGSSTEMTMTHYFAGGWGPPPALLDLSAHVGETFMIPAYVDENVAWFADIREGGATEWTLE